MNARAMPRQSIREQCLIRRASPEDWTALVAMYTSFEPKGAFSSLPPRGDPRPWLESLKGCANFLIEIEDRVVAHGALCPQGDSAEAAVFVHQDYRGCGLGTPLLYGLVAEARRMGLHRIWGRTELSNLAMVRLALSLGFVGCGEPEDFCLDLPARSVGGNIEPSIWAAERERMARHLRAEAQEIREHGFTNFFQHTFTCLRYGQASLEREEHRCRGCTFQPFVPTAFQQEVFPCQHIPPETWGRIAEDADLAKRYAVWLDGVADQLEQQPVRST